MATVTGSYVASGKNPSSEVQQLRLTYSNGTISISGTTAKSTVSATLAVKRDSYGPTYGLDASCYITINGNKKTVTYDGTVDTSWRNVMTHSVTVSYTASSSKSVSLGAGFSISSNTKLKGLVLPASNYSYGTGSQRGSTTLTLPKQRTACGAPTSVTVTRNSGSGSIISRNETIKISWSGAKSGTSNTIATYQVYWYVLKDGQTPNLNNATGSKNVNVTDGTTSGSTTVTLSNATRGYKVMAGVVTRGTAGSSYYSGLKTGGNLKVNSLPNSPSVSPGDGLGVKSNGGDIEFTVTAGSDSDGQSCSLYYSRTKSGTKTKFTSPLTLNFSEGNNEVYFYTYDGMEYSSETSRIVTINTKPVINSLTVSKIELDGLNSSLSIPLVRTGSYSASLNKTVPTYNWYYCESSTSNINTDTGTKHLFSNLSSLSNFNFNELSITPGYYYKIGLIVQDAYEESDIKWETDTAQMPKSTPTAILEDGDVVNSSTGTTIPGSNPANFENEVFIRWTNPTITTGMLNIKESKVIYRVRSDSSSAWGSFIEESSRIIDSGALNSWTVNLTPSRGAQVQFGVRIVDSSDMTQDVYYSQIFSRALLPSFGETILNLTGPMENGILTMRPYTNTNSLSFSSIAAFGENGAKYYLQCIVNDRNVTIELKSNLDEGDIISGDTVYITIPAQEINSLLKDNRLKASASDPTWNNRYSNVIYRMYVKDVFGNDSSNSVVSNVTTIDFIEAPIFQSTNMIQMGIQYYLPNIDNDNFSLSIKYPDTSTSTEAETRNNDRMFNSGEAVVFKFPKPQDYNEDVVSYQIYVSRMDDRPASISKNSSYEDYTYSYLTSFSSSQIKQDIADNQLIYQHPITSYLLNKFLTFYIVAIDSQNNTSNKLYCNTYLVGCRKQNPSAILESAEVTSQNLISIKYSIQDLGGSQFTNSIYKYKASTAANSYPNFERDISIKFSSEDSVETEYIPKTFIHIQYCLDGDFTNTSSENYDYQIISLDAEYSSLGGTINSEAINTIFQNKKLYIRARIVLLTGFGISTENYEDIGDYTKYNVVSTTTEIVTYYANAPTVSHRAHHVGINTNNFNDTDNDEILIISDFMNRKKIILVGTDTSTGEAKEYRITIDLKQGRIDGAYIPGGNWDEDETISYFTTGDGTPFFVLGEGNT